MHLLNCVLLSIEIYSIFEVDGYKLQRRDRTDHGGGIATFMRADIPAWRRFDIEYIPRV